MRENESTEFKREYTSDIKKEVVAFANTKGGYIHIGRDDSGEKYPLANVTQTMSQISNSVRDSIDPDVTMFVSYETNDDEIVMSVSEGTNKPYYLKDKGLKPSGVYVRQGESVAQASFEQIREMIKLTDGDKFETTRSMDQSLTFKETTAEFERAGLPLDRNHMQSLGIINSDDLYTNLGLLLSDQCPYTIKFAVFSGTGKGEFKTRKEITGSLLTQMRGAFDFLSLSNNLIAVVSGLDRVEQYDYPEIAIREAILNAIVHRDYSFSGSIIVNLYDDRAEFISLGGLVAGLSTEDLFVGISQPRNEKLANIFYRLKHIEAYGMGLKLIRQYYDSLLIQPEILATHGAFSLTLPNMNYQQAQKKTSQIHPQQQKVLEYLAKHESITNEDVQKLLGVKQTRGYAIIRQMVNAGYLQRSEHTKYAYLKV